MATAESIPPDLIGGTALPTFGTLKVAVREFKTEKKENSKIPCVPSACNWFHLSGDGNIKNSSCVATAHRFSRPQIEINLLNIIAANRCTT
jgi:hypothetical protein